jgi:hypothetical protein
MKSYKFYQSEIVSKNGIAGIGLSGGRDGDYGIEKIKKFIKKKSAVKPDGDVSGTNYG